MEATELLTADHRAVKELFRSYAESHDDERRRELVEQIIRELSIHAAIEEAKLYPVIRDDVPGGDALYKEGIEEHQEVKEVLAKLDKSLDEAGTERFREQVTRLQRDVEHHVEEEETEVFPKLRQAISSARLQELGRELQEAKASAPTRPHPHQPPATDLTGKATGAVDHVRDRVSGR